LTLLNIFGEGVLENFVFNYYIKIWVAKMPGKGTFYLVWVLPKGISSPKRECRIVKSNRQEYDRDANNNEREGKGRKKMKNEK
jgi:hypothetical protein